MKKDIFLEARRIDKKEIDEHKLQCVDIGCGRKKLPGYIGIDIRKFDEVDHVLNIEKDRFPFEDNSVDAINAEQILEHLGDGLLHCINECWRILKPKGFFRITVPCFPNGVALIHPDHKRFFVQDPFGFYQVPAGDVDPHGYLEGKFWHVHNINEEGCEIIEVVMVPNKPEGFYQYKEIE